MSRPCGRGRRVPSIPGFVLVCAVTTLACGTMKPPSVRDARLTSQPVAGDVHVSQLELQQTIQRFTGEFFDGVAQSMEAPYANPKLQQARLRQFVLYGSSALDIASGPQPEVNVLDMLVFVSLSRQTLEAYWVPHVFGAQGKGLVTAFTASERKLWKISDTIMSSVQQRELRDLIDVWRAGHPNQTRVEWVRFQDFSSHTGEIAEERAAGARRLFGGIRSAAQTADQALLLTERAMFLAHRMPFLVRLQARLGVQETLDDSLSKLDDVQGLMTTVPQLAPILRDAALLSTSAEAAAREGRLFFGDVEPLLQSLKIIRTEPGAVDRPATIDLVEVQRLLDSSNRLAERSGYVVQELRGLTASQKGLMTAANSPVDQMVRRWLTYLVLLGALWATFFWGGYYIAKRAVAHSDSPPPAAKGDDEK